MAYPAPPKEEILDAIRRIAAQVGKAPSRSQFFSATGISEHNVLKYFASWNDAVYRAGLTPYTANVKLDDAQLLEDWATLVRKYRQIPTRDQYRREGKYSPTSFEKHFGPWSTLPAKFREFGRDKLQWADVVAFLPASVPQLQPTLDGVASPIVSIRRIETISNVRHAQRRDRPTYGNPIDFRGLRHEPVNEQGVVFLFGMVAKELGYMVEAVQTGYPDCDAKRQIGPNKWQRVRIEFEFESRNFRDHGHVCDGCDIIVCWRHNWPECPENLQVVELRTVINSLSRSED
jgi:Homing endonuclease associated repeat